MKHCLQEVGIEVRQRLKQMQSAPPAVQAELRLQLRARLEAVRASLLGPYVRLPETLRHPAVSLTEVQWLLDVWIADCAAGGADEAQLRRDFLQAALRLFGDVAPRVAPAPKQRGAWWSRPFLALQGRWRNGRAKLGAVGMPV